MPPKGVARFPSGRIKKIMQQDEEVGRVAKATPVLVSKAVEILIAELMKKACKISKAKGSNIVQAKHLQEAVAGEKIFDFLQDVVGRFVPSAEDESKVIGSDIEDEAPEIDSDSSDDEAGGPSGGRGRGRGRGRGVGRGRGRGRGRGATVAAAVEEGGAPPPAKKPRGAGGGRGSRGGGRGRGRGRGDKAGVGTMENDAIGDEAPAAAGPSSGKELQETPASGVEGDGVEASKVEDKKVEPAFSHRKIDDDYDDDE